MSHLDNTFGVEIECYLPYNMSRNVAADRIAAALEPVGSDVSRVGLASRRCQVEHLNHTAREHTWKIVLDGSLRDSIRGIEVVSPKLTGLAGLKQVEIVCKTLVDIGCTVNHRCGLHVHTGAGSTIRFFRNITKLYAKFEPVIDTMMPASRRGSENYYCVSLVALDAAAVDLAQTRTQLITLISRAQRGTNRRYSKINLAAYTRHRTVENRHHAGSIDYKKVCPWIILCLRMTHVAKSRNFEIKTATLRNKAKPGSKTYLVGELMLRPEGVNRKEVCAATGWPSVQIPYHAEQCGLPYTTRRTGRNVRYFASSSNAPTNSLDSFLATIEADSDDRRYVTARIAELAANPQAEAA